MTYFVHLEEWSKDLLNVVRTSLTLGIINLPNQLHCTWVKVKITRGTIKMMQYLEAETRVQAVDLRKEMRQTI